MVSALAGRGSVLQFMSTYRSRHVPYFPRYELERFQTAEVTSKALTGIAIGAIPQCYDFETQLHSSSFCQDLGLGLDS